MVAGTAAGDAASRRLIEFLKHEGVDATNKLGERQLSCRSNSSCLDLQRHRCQIARMTIAALKDALNARPFRPFVVHLPGRTVDITHPEQFAFPNDGVSAIILTRDGHIHILDVREINGLELRPARRGKAA